MDEDYIDYFSLEGRNGVTGYPDSPEFSEVGLKNLTCDADPYVDRRPESVIPHEDWDFDCVIGGKSALQCIKWKLLHL